MVIPFQFEKLRKLLSTKFGQRLILMWPFSETNAAAMRALKTRAGSCRRVLPPLLSAMLAVHLKSVADILRSLTEYLRALRAFYLDFFVDHEMCPKTHSAIQSLRGC
jgi:hypothetical protein